MKNLLNNPTFNALRPNQWIKNLILFADIIFTGKLFVPYYFWITTLGFLGLIAALLISLSFFSVALLFILLHIFYSVLFKKHAVYDIFGISLSFILRAYAGEVLTGFHLPFWLFLTILFVALFVAATKRHAELLRSGRKTRPALFQYRDKLLDSYTSMFGSASIIAYSLFTFLEEPPQFSTPIKQF